MEIAAAIISVVLAAIIGVQVKQHRSLVTYEIATTRSEFFLKGNAIFETSADDSKIPFVITSHFIKLVNRGWKSVSDLRIHSESGKPPISKEVQASSISPSTVTIGMRGKDLEISVDFLPPKEEIKLGISYQGYPNIYKLTGAGAAYRVESVHYYEGYKVALNFVKNLLIGGLIFALIGINLGSIAVEKSTAQAQRAREEVRRDAAVRTSPQPTR